MSSVHPVFKALITLMLITLGFSQVNYQTLFFYLNETTYSAALFLFFAEFKYQSLWRNNHTQQVSGLAALIEMKVLKISFHEVLRGAGNGFLLLSPQINLTRSFQEESCSFC